MRGRRIGFGLLASVVAGAVVVAAVVARVGFGLSVPARVSRTPARRAGAVANAVGLKREMTFLKLLLEPPVIASASEIPQAPPGPRPVAFVRPHLGNRPLRILVVGSSVGVTFAAGMQLWAQAHDATVLDDARYWCPLGRWLPLVPGIGLEVPGLGCSDWGTRWARDIDSFDPDVVLVYFSIWEIAPRLLPGHTDLEQPGSPALDAWQLSEYKAAADVLSARGAPVVWFTIPCENQPILAGSPFWYVNRRTIPALAESRPAVHVIDLDHELCASGVGHGYAGVAQARPDGAHYSDVGALAVANWVMPIVQGQAPNPVTVDERNPAPESYGVIRRAG